MLRSLRVRIPLTIGATIVLIVAAPLGLAQPPKRKSGSPPPVVTPASPTSGMAESTGIGRWKLESLHLKDGTEFRGLIQGRRESEYDFAEIVQPEGKPMFAVIRGVPRSAVVRAIELPPQEHDELAERLSRFRSRTIIEAGRAEQIELESETVDGVAYRVYRGDWFQVWSTTVELPTRRSVVRLEQVFRAFRTLLPPRAEPRGVLRIYLYGSLNEYRARLRQMDLAIENPAFYSPRQQMIVAGSELTSFAERLAELRRQTEEMQQRYAQLDGEFTKSLARLSDELRQAGFTQDEIVAELNLRKSQWKKETKDAQSELARAERRNEAKFDRVTAQMFARLYHEAFHAYLDAFVYPHDQHRVPRWLNEGLAQVFESGQLEGDSLRIDAPARDRLLALQADWQTEPRLSLAQLLTSADQPFLVAHAGAGGKSEERMYLHAWGLAWHLTFQKNLLGEELLEEYLAAEAGQAGPIERFERLVGQPIDRFEAEWRRKLAELKPPPR